MALALPKSHELIWAKVPGWEWWPSRVLQQKQEQGDDGSNGSVQTLVFFYADNTCAWVTGALLPFDQHYQRFLTPAYSNKVRPQDTDHQCDGHFWQCFLSEKHTMQHAMSNFQYG